MPKQGRLDFGWKIIVVTHLPVGVEQRSVRAGGCPGAEKANFVLPMQLGPPAKFCILVKRWWRNGVTRGVSLFFVPRASFLVVHFAHCSPLACSPAVFTWNKIRARREQRNRSDQIRPDQARPDQLSKS